MMTMTSRRPIGKQLRRAANVRRATVEGIRVGRERATEALLLHARDRAIRHAMPFGIQTACTWLDRAREWVLNIVARIVAGHIERSSFKAAVERLEERKIGGQHWEQGVWEWISAMRDVPLGKQTTFV
jgi:hypothetical protein